MRYQLLLIVVIFLTACNSKVKQANKRGLEYMKQNLYEQAITEFDNALSINNTWFPVYTTGLFRMPIPAVTKKL